ncbi:hypothetical protein JCM10213_006839 [Rhodosporidiobolus nylandii]
MQRTPTLPRRVSLHPPPSPSPVYPHRRRRRLLPWVHSGINTLLILLIAGGVLVALTDVVWQFANSNRASKVADILTALGTYSAFILLTSILVLVRLVKSVHTMTKIPLAYLPTSEEDVSKTPHTLIQNEYERACLITKSAQPTNRCFAGWGRPDTAYEGLHFRTAILETVPALRLSVASSFPSLALPVGRSASPSPLAPLLALEPCPFPPALLPLAKVYEQKLVEAKYGKRQSEKEDWEVVVRVVAVFVGFLQQAKSEGTASEPSTSAAD